MLQQRLKCGIRRALHELIAADAQVGDGVGIYVAAGNRIIELCLSRVLIDRHGIAGTTLLTRYKQLYSCTRSLLITLL